MEIFSMRQGAVEEIYIREYGSLAFACLGKVYRARIVITIELTLLVIFIIKFAFNFLSLPNNSQISFGQFISMKQSAFWAITNGMRAVISSLCIAKPE